MKKLNPIFLSAVSVLVLFVGYQFMLNGGVSYSENDPTFNRLYWSEKLDRFGQERAYKSFIEKNNKLNFDRQHLAAHVFGELLFEKFEVDGISVCDSSFGFGCYHGLFTRAVSQNGLSIVEEFDSACVKAYTALGTGCQHGIGHGIMEYLGYADIQTALDACKDTTELVPLLGCSSGVFMEYFTPLTYTEDSIKVNPRAYDESDPYHPCGLVTDEYKPSCYFELSNWWSTVFKNDYKHVGGLCAGLENIENRKNCFLGVGSTIVTRENLGVKEIITYCGVFKSGNDERDCRSGAAWRFFADPELRQQAPSLCEGLLPDDTVMCIKNADFTEGLDPNHI